MNKHAHAINKCYKVFLFKKKKKKGKERGWEFNSVVEQLPSKHKALGLFLSSKGGKNLKKNKKKDKKREMNEFGLERWLNT